MLLTALLVAAASAGQPALAPALGTPASAARRAGGVRLVFDGGPADVLIGAPGVGVTRLQGVTSPADLGRLRPGDRVRVERDGEVVAELDGTLVWTPADVAAWSGPGLRGALVTALAPATNGLWAATAGGGLALWDGEAWRHLGRRQGFDELVADVSIAEGVRWIADVDGVTRLDADGRALTFRVGDLLPDAPVLAVRARSGRAAVALTTDGVTALGVDAEGRPTAVPLVEDRACRRLVGPDDALTAVCAHAWTGLDPSCAVDTATPCPPPALAPTLVGARAVLPALGGRLVADDRTVRRERDGVGEVIWASATPELRDVDPMGRGLLVAAGPNGAVHVGVDLARSLHRASGVPGRLALVTAPGPTPHKAWLGTDRGVALVTEADTATPLPLAPLAAGIPVLAVAGDGDVALAATEDGLAWVGRAPPGGDALRAAVTGLVVQVARVGRDWWVLGAQHAWRLDRRGALTRWDLDGRGVDLAALGDTVVIATDRGLRGWVPGAKMLGPVEPVSGIRALAAGADGALWVLTADEVRRLRGAPEAWAVADGRALVAAGPGAIVATPEGPRWLTPGHDAPTAPEAEGLKAALVDVAVADGALWTLGADGAVARDGLPVAYVEAPIALAVDRAGVWVATWQGLWRIVP